MIVAEKSFTNRFTGGNGSTIDDCMLRDADRESWKELFNLDDNTFSQCEASYDRTMAIVGPGLEDVNAWLAGN